MINPSDSAALVKAQIEDAVALAGYSAPTSWADATDKINGTASQFERGQIADGMNGGMARDRINALFGGPVWAPEGAQLAIDFAANKAWVRNSAVTDSVGVVSLTRAGEVLMLGPDGYQSFPANTLARIDGIGAQVAPARVNKCTNWNGAPTAVDLNKVGGSEVILSVVDDTAALIASGQFTELLAQGRMNGNAYKLDNSASSSQAQAQNTSGQTGNTNPHTTSVWVRGTGFAIIGTGTSAEGTTSIQLTNEYQRISAYHPAPAENSFLSVRATPGSVVYFILNQLEEGPFATDPIITSGAAVARPGDILSASVPDGGRAGVIEFDLLEPPAGNGNTLFFNFKVSSDPGSGYDRFSLGRSSVGASRLHVSRGSVYIGAAFGPSFIAGRNVVPWVMADNYARIGIIGAGDGTPSTTLGNVPSNISLLAIGGDGSTSNNNPFIHAHRFTERPVTDFATPADAFAWAKSIAQGWAS